MKNPITNLKRWSILLDIKIAFVVFVGCIFYACWLEADNFHLKKDRAAPAYNINKLDHQVNFEKWKTLNNTKYVKH
jgi:hypothetical protein